MNSKIVSVRKTLLVVVLMLGLAGIAAGPASASGWLYPTFEENLQVSFEPAAPNNLDPVNVTLDAKASQVIGGANLYYNITREGSSTPVPGGPYGGEFRFADDQHSSMYFVIPGAVNAGGNTVSFYVVAWDTSNQRLTSMLHEYRPAENGSFASDSFSENVAVESSPGAPRALEPVTVTVRSLDQGVRL